MYGLLDFVGLDRHAARERIFVGQHQGQAYIVFVGGFEFRVARLIGVVRNLHALRIETPEARPSDGAGILADERVGAVAGERIGDAGVGEERKIVLPGAVVLARRAGVFAAQSGHRAPAAEVRRNNAVDRRDMFRVVEPEAVGLVAQPCFGRAVFVERMVAHVVVGVLGSGPQRPFRAEMLVEGQRGGRNVVVRRRAVAVERIERAAGRGNAAGIVVARIRGAEVVVGQQSPRCRA